MRRKLRLQRNPSTPATKWRLPVLKAWLVIRIFCTFRDKIYPSSYTKSTEDFYLSVEFQSRARSRSDHTQPVGGVQRLSLSRGDYGGKCKFQTFPHGVSVSRQTAGVTMRIPAPLCGRKFLNEKQGGLRSRGTACALSEPDIALCLYPVAMKEVFLRDCDVEKSWRDPLFEVLHA